MSRILIKNLPPSLKLSDFKTHFSTTSSSEKELTITDAKLPTKKDGTFRRFGFVGYKTTEEAEKAKEWFDGTFFGSCKIRAEVVADGLKAEPPLKKRRLSPTPNSDTNTNISSKILETDEALLAKYMEAKKPRKKNAPSWADNVTAPSAPPAAKSPPENEKPEEEEEGPVSDMDWLKSKMTSDSGVAAQGEFFQDEDERKAEDQQPQETIDDTPQLSEAAQTILTTARLFVRNLTFSVTEAELSELFLPYGEIEQIHIPKTPSHEGKGLAYITFKHAPHALRAFDELDGRTFQGRLLHVLPAVGRQSRFEADAGKTVKDKQLESKKKEAKTGGGGWDWGVLYMNSDAVASSIASRFNVAKTDILGEDDDPSKSSTNPAVKLALAETHIIQETRKHLASQGVHLDSFAVSGDRKMKSQTTLLVKNIPYGTADSTLRDMFASHGHIVRLIVPPAGTMAVVEYDDPHGSGSCVESAIKNLSYRRLGNSVLYLERAPASVWAVPKGSVVPNGDQGGPAPVTISSSATTEPIAAGTTLFVKNLSFNTSSETLSRAFRSLPSFSYARVATKPDPKLPDGKLSMGFGFVGFASIEAAQKGLKSMDGYVLDGHKLVVSFAGRGADVETETKRIGKSKTTKMIVKNVPFEASKKDIRQLFGAHGQLKSVRLPKRFDTRSRGFAFLDFITHTEAEQAYAALKHTHLLGRHLVLEWAEDEGQDIDKLREKVGVGYGEGKGLPGKKRKLVMGDDGEESGEE